MPLGYVSARAPRPPVFVSLTIAPSTLSGSPAPTLTPGAPAPPRPLAAPAPAPTAADTFSLGSNPADALRNFTGDDAGLGGRWRKRKQAQPASEPKPTPKPGPKPTVAKAQPTAPVVVDEATRVKEKTAALEKTYGVKITSDGGRVWNSDELEQLDRALAKVPPGDRKALEGLEFRRVRTIPDRDVAGLYHAKGHLIEIDDGGLRRPPEAGDGYVESPTDKQQRLEVGANTILHEVGHAVMYADFAKGDAGALTAQKFPLDGKPKNTALMTSELAELVKLARENKLAPHTEYGATSWSAGKPHEFFADAYADYLSHPERLHPKVLAFFEARHPKG